MGDAILLTVSLTLCAPTSNALWASEISMAFHRTQLSQPPRRLPRSEQLCSMRRRRDLGRRHGPMPPDCQRRVTTAVPTHLGVSALRWPLRRIGSSGCATCGTLMKVPPARNRRSGPPGGWVPVLSYVSHCIADHEWRCCPLHKDAQRELAHIGTTEHRSACQSCGRAREQIRSVRRAQQCRMAGSCARTAVLGVGRPSMSSH